MGNVVRDHKRPCEPLTAANDHIPDASMKHIPKTRTRLGGRFFGVFDMLRDLSVCHRSRTISFRSNLSIADPAVLFTMLMIFASLVNLANASAPPSSTSTFSIYALNANGLVQPVKQSSVNSIIKASGPQVFVLGETKTKSKLKDSLPSEDYDIYEEPGEQDESHHPVKWGIVVGVRKDIQIAQRLEIKHKSLKGRVIALDLVLPTSDGRCFPHRFVGVYAPWNPGDEGVSRSFWHDMTDICRSTPHAWTIAGDLNATVSRIEKASGGADARAQYLQFLTDTDAQDIWSNYPDRSRRMDWTCRGHYSDGPIPEGSIIDRVATSRSSLCDSDIYTASRYRDWIPYTDHRAVVAHVTHAIPDTGQDGNTNWAENFIRQHSSKPRIKVPSKTEKHRYQVFSDTVDEAIRSSYLIMLSR
jgi:hypothetical protein